MGTAAAARPAAGFFRGIAVENFIMNLVKSPEGILGKGFGVTLGATGGLSRVKKVNNLF